MGLTVRAYRAKQAGLVGDGRYRDADSVDLANIAQDWSATRQNSTDAALRGTVLNMNLTIQPNVLPLGLHPGMDRAAVRQLIRGGFSTFRRSEFSRNTTDFWEDGGIFATYDECDALEALVVLHLRLRFSGVYCVLAQRGRS